MAKPDEGTSGGDPGKGPNLIVGLLICLILGGACGAGFGYYLTLEKSAPGEKKAEPAPEEKEKVEIQHAARFPHDALEFPVEPIIVSIGPELKTNVRLEFSIVVASGTRDEGTLKGEIREDAIAFLKGLDIVDLEGGRRFQLLREQLDDRARVRGQGAVLGILISGLIVQ